MTKKALIPALLYTLIFINIFDIFIHVITGQPEALRITSNLLVIISSVLILINHRYNLLFAVSLSAYVLLNMLFVVMNGIGALGVVLITVTTLAGIVVSRKLVTSK